MTYKSVNIKEEADFIAQDDKAKGMSEPTMTSEEIARETEKIAQRFGYGRADTAIIAEAITSLVTRAVEGQQHEFRPYHATSAKFFLCQDCERAASAPVHTEAAPECLNTWHADAQTAGCPDCGMVLSDLRPSAPVAETYTVCDACKGSGQGRGDVTHCGRCGGDGTIEVAAPESAGGEECKYKLDLDPELCLSIAEQSEAYARMARYGRWSEDRRVWIAAKSQTDPVGRITREGFVIAREVVSANRADPTQSVTPRGGEGPKAYPFTDQDRVHLYRVIAESDIAGCELTHKDIDDLVSIFQSWLERFPAWRDGATAPQDGTAFRAYNPDLVHSDFNPLGTVEAVFDGNKFIGAVWDGQFDCWNTVEIVPTFWQPLTGPTQSTRPTPAASDAQTRVDPQFRLDAWPLSDVLTQLASWAEHFSHVHNCDCEGWEATGFLITAARQYASGPATSGVEALEAAAKKALREGRHGFQCDRASCVCWKSAVRAALTALRDNKENHG